MDGIGVQVGAIHTRPELLIDWLLVSRQPAQTADAWPGPMLDLSLLVECCMQNEGAFLKLTEGQEGVDRRSGLDWCCVLILGGRPEVLVAKIPPGRDFDKRGLGTGDWDSGRAPSTLGCILLLVCA